MIDHIYVERDLEPHPRVERILRQYPKARRISIGHYGEIFNRRAQNFRLQKQRPALILARKLGRRILDAPEPYGIGCRHNYYFSHVLNCLYDCRYCFLQGMYRSAHYVLFVNYEDFQHDIDATIAQAAGQSTCFFSGYDGDSLALERLSGFVSEFLPFVAARPGATFELRTKSTAIAPLTRVEALDNCVVAFSFTPDETNRSLEHGVATNRTRILAAADLATRGWPIGLRFDPLIYSPDFTTRYEALFARVFTALPMESIHSVSWGSFRLPKKYFKTMSRLYPEEPLMSSPLGETRGLVSYAAPLEDQMRAFCAERLGEFAPKEKLFPIVAAT